MNNNHSNSNTHTKFISILDLTRTDLFLWQTGAFLFPVLGIPGHFVVLLTIFYSKNRQIQPLSFYLISISIIESIYLVFMFWDWLDVVNLAANPRRILDCAFFYPFVSGTGFISLILLVELNLDRIFIIYRPYQSYNYFTYKRMIIKLSLTMSIFVIFLVNYRFSVYYDSKSFVIFGQSCRVYKHAQTWFYFIWPYLQLIARFISTIIILICTLFISYNLWYKNSIHHIFRYRQQKSSSLILVIFSIYTFLAITPISILQLFNKDMFKYELEYICYECLEIKAHEWKLANTICIMLESSIYMNKFYIQYLFSSKFRHEVKQLIYFRSSRKTCSIKTQNTLIIKIDPIEI